MIRLRIAPIISFLFLILTVPLVSYAGENLLDFEGPGSMRGWRVERASYGLDGGRISLKDGSFPVIYSPGRLNVSAKESVLTLRIKSNKAGLVPLSIYSAHTNFTYVVDFRVRATDDFHDYRVYLGDIVPKSEVIYDFAFKLPGNKLNASIDSIRFHSPSSLELAGILWEGFWTPEPIEVGTSNRLRSPRLGTISMLTLLYLLIPFSVVVFAVVLFFRTGRLTRATFFKAFVAAFALSAFLFTVRMDVNWLGVWSVDRAALTGKSEAERIRAINNGNYDSYFDFIDEMKIIIPRGEKAMPAGRRVNAYNDHVARSVAYYLLPVRTVPKANYMWLYFDEIDAPITYDADRATLKKGKNIVAKGVSPVRLFAGEAALYKKGVYKSRGGK